MATYKTCLNATVPNSSQVSDNLKVTGGRIIGFSSNIRKNSSDKIVMPLTGDADSTRVYKIQGPPIGKYQVQSLVIGPGEYDAGGLIANPVLASTIRIGDIFLKNAFWTGGSINTNDLGNGDRTVVVSKIFSVLGVNA